MSKKRGLISKAFGTNLIKGAFSQTVSMVKSASPRNKEYIKETFSEAMNRHGISREEESAYLLRIYKNLKVQYIILLFGQLYLLYFGVIKSLMANGYLISFTYSLLIFALFCLGAQYSLRCYQIRKKRLGMLKEWFSSPSQWYPKKITKEYLDSFESEKPEEKKDNEKNLENQ